MLREVTVSRSLMRGISSQRLFITIAHAYHMYRYRDIPTFGRDTIRKFVKNVSGMSKLAARDFEDLLQVYHLFSFSFILC